MSSKTQRSHFIREVVLQSLRTAQPYGILIDQVHDGLVSSPGATFITRPDAEVEFLWLQQKSLVEITGSGDGRRILLSAKGLTFVNAGMPWSELEVLE